MRKKSLICAMCITMLFTSSCTSDNADTELNNIDLEGVNYYSYYFHDDSILIYNQDRVMYSDWDEVRFDYICADPICAHSDEGCMSYSIENKKDRESNVAFSIEYGDKLIFFETYFNKESEQLEGKNHKDTYIYYTKVYEAKLDGSGRQHKLTLNGSSPASVSVSGVMVVGGKIYFAGPKEDICITEYETDEYGNEIVTMTYDCDDALYCVDLTEYTVTEFAAEYNKTYSDYFSELSVSGDNLYYCVRSYENNDTTIYKVDMSTKECELICREEEHYYLIGALDDVVYYASDTELYYRKLSDKNTKHTFQVPETELGTVIANVVDDKLAVLTAYSEKDSNYEIEYTFYNAEGSELQKYTYDDYFVFGEVIGNKATIIKPFAKEQLWWNDVNDLENVLEDATYIGSFTGAEYDVLD